ncbi:MAG: hypothetical protein KKA60_10880 [Proteobacteria bacterium]|nr:hypothetical protein [Pseudomonadota bacterium]
MGVLVFGLGIVGAGFLVQLVVWRVRTPRRHTRAIVVIFFLALAAGLVLARTVGQGLGVIGIVGLAHVSLFVLSFLAAWIISYSALEAQSPTLVMMEKIAGAGEKGVDEEEFYRDMGDELLVLPRLDDLVRDRLAVLQGGLYVLTPKGRALAGLMAAWRRLLGAGQGG